MLFSGRAYYNLLWLSKRRGQNIPAEDWESLDYRDFSTDALFTLLHTYHLSFDTETFICASVDLDTPEELLERYEPEDGVLKRKIYVVFFELWRRLLPEKVSISIFCDELDRTIATYESTPDDDILFDLLNEVLEILDRNTESGESPKVIFERFCLYIAHDLENVIYTYIDSKIKEESEDAFLGFIDYFMPYVRERRALQFLKLKTLSDAFSEERKTLADFLVSSLQESMNFALSIPVLFFLIEEKHSGLFSELFSYLIEHITEEKKLVALLDVLIEYHQAMGQAEKQDHVHNFLTLFLSTSKKKPITKASKHKVLSLL